MDTGEENKYIHLYNNNNTYNIRYGAKTYIYVKVKIDLALTSDCTKYCTLRDKHLSHLVNDQPLSR